MNKIKRAFLKLLQGNVIYDDDIVPVVIKDYWYDTTPCITISGMDRTKRSPRQRTTECHPLPETHPLYDPANPYKKYPHLVEKIGRSYEIWINIWCNNERERELITNQVKDCLFYCTNHHYKYCINYDKDTNNCLFTETTCEAITDNGYHGLRGQCPKPYDNGYCNLFTSNGIKRNTLQIGADYERDEYDHKPPLKRTIIEISFDYTDKRIFPSNPTNCLISEFNGENIIPDLNEYYG